MNKVLEITAARARLGRLVQEAFLERRRILIGKHGVPMAALLSVAEYERLLQDLRDMQEAEAEHRRTAGKRLEKIVKELKGRR